MTGQIEKIPTRQLRSVLGVDANGIAGLQGVNTCPNLVALYGDSLIAQTFMDGLRLRRSVYNDVAIANALAGQRMIFAMKRAVSGWRSDQILQRFLADVADGSLVASRCGTLIFSMGTNDFAQATYTDAVSGASMTQANVADNVVTNAARLIDTAMSLGIQCIFRTVHGASNYTAIQIAAVEDANRKIRMLPQGRRMWLLEVRDALRDSLTTTGNAITFKANHMANDLGPVFVHEGIQGAVAVGKRLADIVKAAIPALPSAYVDATAGYSTNLPSQLINNPTFAGTGGTLGAGGALGTNPSGGALASVPSGWHVRRSVGDSTTTFTVNVGEDSAGRYLEVVANASTSGSLWIQQEIAPSRWASGDGLQLFATVEISSGAINLAMAAPLLEVNGTKDGVASSLIAQGCGHTNGTVYGAFPTNEAFVFEDASEVLTVPDYDTRNWIVCRAMGATFIAAGSATIRIRRPRLEKVAAITPVLA